MPARPQPAVRGVARETLSFALSAAEDAHPNEYLGLLRGTAAADLDLGGEGTVITDVLVIPGTQATPVSATFRSNLVPNDRHAVGSVHSHPNGVLRPSAEDKRTFGSGVVHLILGAPYDSECWRAFDRRGEPTTLDVLDVELPDPESFFDFTQADIDEELGR